MQYFPEKLGFVFCEATHADIRPVENEEDSDNEDDEINTYTGTPFQLARKEYGHDAVIKIFNDRISDHCAAINSVAAAVTNTSPATCAESKLLLLAVTDKTIHLDGLYILMRNDPTAALLRLQQQLLIRERQTDNTNNNSNNDNNNDNDNNTDTFSATLTTSSSSSSSNIISSCITTNNNNNNNNNNETQSSSEGKKRKHNKEDDTGDNISRSKHF